MKLSILLFVLGPLAGCDSSDTPAEYPVGKSYSILELENKSFSSVGLKKVIKRIVVSGEYDRQDLQKVLDIELTNARQGHDQAIVWVYSNLEHWRKSGTYWVAMGEWSDPDAGLSRSGLNREITRCCEIDRCHVPGAWAWRGDVNEVCYTDGMGEPIP